MFTGTYYKVKVIAAVSHTITICTLTAESVLGTCIAYLANSNIIENWSNTDTDTRIGAALLFIDILIIIIKILLLWHVDFS